MYISIGIKNLALSMAGIFVPLYLYLDMGYPLSKVFLFYMIYSLAMMVTCPFAAKFISKHGVKHGILTSMFGFIMQIILLSTLSFHNLFFLPALVGGMANSFYWISFHTDFAKFSDKKKRGQEVSLWFITAFLGILLGPILGSIIITYLGFVTLFIIVSLLLLLSAVPLFMSSEVHTKTTFLFKDIFKKSRLKETYVYIVMGFRVIIAQVALPIFIFLMLDKYLSLGAIASFAALGSIIIGYFVGKLSNNERREKTMLRYGSLFHSVGWFALLFLKTFVQLAFINIYLAMSYIFVDIPHHTAVYGKAKKSGNTTGYFVYREMMIAFGRFLGVLVLLVTGSLVVGFIIGGVGMATWFFI
tara:strand:- start:1679 stop:2752 length:1074 start_codon:yes stop_codon:yes gene_type:complete